jgi:uncharacterized protein YndB with AHSA1/START domain
MAQATSGRTTFTMPSDRTVRAVREFDAPRDLIWRAHTEPEHVKNWMLGPDGWTMPVCEIDLRPGGRWHWRWRNEKTGEEFGMTGEYREVRRPERLVNTESWGDDWPESVSTAEFAEANGKTTLTVTAEWPSKEARDRAIATGMNEGWGKSYDRLEEMLAQLRRD